MTTKYNLDFRAGHVRNQIIDYLAQHPGADCRAISRDLGIDQKSATNALGTMHAAGLTVRRRTGKTYAYMLKDRNTHPTTQASPAAPTDVLALQVQVVELQARLHEREAVVLSLQNQRDALEAFKAEALARYPDLQPVDYEAHRGALAAYYHARDWPEIAEGIRDGVRLTLDDRQSIDGLLAAARLLSAGGA